MESNISGSFLFNNSLNQFSSDIKAPVCQYSIPNSFYKLSPANINSQLQAGTPHGISDILSRSMMGGPGTPALLSGYPSMGGFGTAVPSPGVYYNRDYAPSGLSSFSKPGVECSGLKGKGSSCWVDGGYEWRGARQQCPNSKSVQYVRLIWSITCDEIPTQ